MVNQMWVTTPGPSDRNSSWVAPGAMGQRSELPPVRSIARLLERFIILRACVAREQSRVGRGLRTGAGTLCRRGGGAHAGDAGEAAKEASAK